MSETIGMNRRRFLKNSAIGVGAVGVVGASVVSGGNLLHSLEKPVEEKSFKIKEYRTLGRTGFKVSDISTGYVKNPAVLEKLLDAGVNYIDTAESYRNEPEVGSVIKKRDRKKLFITTKLEIKDDLTKEGFLKRARKCLERLQTDYIDCMMMHSAESVKVLKTEGFHAAMQQLKTEGKLRHVGVSNHGSNHYLEPKESMEKILTAAAMDGRFDVMLLAYNFIQSDNGAKVLEVCKEKNIGATLMKVNPIGSLSMLKERVKKLKEEGKKIQEYYPAMIAKLEGKAKLAESFIKKYDLGDEKKMRDAAIRYCLSNTNAHTVCCGFRNFDYLEAFLPLSGTRLGGMEKKKLAMYKEGCGSLYCRHACGLCESSCPNRVRVNSVMRYNHYFEAQGKEKFAMKNYARLEAKADLCANCKGFCESACPYDVPVHALLNLAHSNLSLA
ncbi:MAG: twin-arginine translocation signal domain-containing protein [bacterium]|nr:twin-arginine translocation signal domain-containing protein [bacterium]